MRVKIKRAKSNRTRETIARGIAGLSVLALIAVFGGLDHGEIGMLPGALIATGALLAGAVAASAGGLMK